MKTFKLDILTPYGKYFSRQVNYLEVRSDLSVLGIYPDHAPLISTLTISSMKIKFDDSTFEYAIGGGVIFVKKDNEVVLLLDSVERADEIDLERAKQSKERAEKRLNYNEEGVDIKRAKISLARALNRIRLLEKE